MYDIVYLAAIVEQHIPALPKKSQLQIRRAIEERLMVDPVAFGKPLQYSLAGHRRLRVGDYRIVYRIQPDEKQVLIVAIQHRKDVYR